METTTTTATEIAAPGQWDDFLVRRWDPYAKTKYDILLERLGDVRGKSALIVGAGSGEFAAYLAQRGAQVLATDIDEEILKLARETAGSLNVNVQTAVARIESVSLDTQYDLVVALDVLEHIGDDRAAFRRLSLLTKSEGTLLLTVPALPFVFGNHDVALGHFRRYTRASLTDLVGEHAEIAWMRYFGFSLIPAALVLSRLLRRPYPVAVVGKASLSRSLMGAIVRTVFGVEKLISPPLGVSLLMQARPPRGGAARGAS